MQIVLNVSDLKKELDDLKDTLKVGSKNPVPPSRLVLLHNEILALESLFSRLPENCEDMYLYNFEALVNLEGSAKDYIKVEFQNEDFYYEV